MSLNDLYLTKQIRSGMMTYAFKYTDCTKLHECRANTLTKVKCDFKDYVKDLDVFEWVTSSGRWFCVATFRDGEWYGGYGYDYAVSI